MAAAGQSQELLARLKLALEQGGGLQAAAEMLQSLRPMHPAGAAKVAAGDEKLAALLAAGAGAAPILARLEELAAARTCLACGTCCVTSSPTLYREDLGLVRSGAIPLSRLFALRAGERAFSARLQKSAPLETELIKLAEAPEGGCVFLENCLCSVYASRPLQCRTLKCWEDSHAGKLEGLPRPGREDILAGDETALTLAREYDLKIPARELDQALWAVAAGDDRAGRRALELLELDHRLRAGAKARYGFDRTYLALLWGRPGPEIISAYGLSLALDQNGAPRLEPRISRRSGGGKV